ncbi:hypothetical protein SteCoe_7336 [Stentor coeruleus]|uniref:Uncharacterized protein n=1 Tax=Stentor coeruleus TaxID=5963 RepID=A0A1R2CMS0_9CILI|nr:hypothetical protein SteCoe_7336 [Stentor coeruleus]
MKNSSCNDDSGEIIENIGSLRDFLNSAENSPSRFLRYSKICSRTRPNSRNNSPLSYHIISRKTIDTKISPVKNIASMAVAVKNLENSPPAVVRVKIDKNAITDTKSSELARQQISTPDYSRIKSRVGSIRGRSDKVYNKIGVSLQDKVRNEILLKKDQIILRTMNKALRSDEKQISAYNHESDAGFIRLSEKIRNPKIPSEDPSKRIKARTSSNVAQKSSDASMRNIMISQSKWLKSHGNNDNSSIPIAKQIISMLDSHNSTGIPADKFVSFLIEIGLPVPIKCVINTLQSLLHTKDIKTKYIYEEHILLLCRSDKKNTHILTIINQETAKINNKPLDQITSAEQSEVISKWWEKLDESGKKIVPFSIICDFLVLICMFTDILEAKKFLVNICKDREFIDKCQFKMIFTRALIKHTLMNINKKFTQEDWDNPALSFAYKLCQLKRQLILAGIKYPIPNISKEEGELALKAMESMEKFTFGCRKKVDYEDFKVAWLKNTGLNLDTVSPDRTTPFDTIESQTELAIYYPKDEKDCKIERFDKEDNYREDKDESIALRDNIRGNTIGFLLFGDIERRARAKEYTTNRSFRPINKDELRWARQTVLLDHFRKIINKVNIFY